MFALLGKATETDSWTYRHIQLEDSASKINSIFDRQLEEIVRQVNLQNQQQLQKTGQPLTDSEIERQMSALYFKKNFKGKIADDVFGMFELCIDSNNCAAWPKFERIQLKPEESVYAQANYSEVTKHFVASQIQLCGVRMGTDKLTHMLKDGFRFYDYSMDASHPDWDEKKVRDVSLYLENTVMGTKFTGVFCASDIEANVQGYHLFNKLFRQTKRDPNTGMIETPKVDLCDYVNAGFDETVLKNRYVHSNKLDQLEAAIQERETDEKWKTIKKDELMNRSVELSSQEKLEAEAASNRALRSTAASLVFKFLGSSDFREATAMFRTEVDRQHRKPTHFRSLPSEQATPAESTLPITEPSSPPGEVGTQ